MSIPSRNVTFNKPAEPAFLKAFKSKVGYKEPVGLGKDKPIAAKSHYLCLVRVHRGEKASPQGRGWRRGGGGGAR